MNGIVKVLIVLAGLLAVGATIGTLYFAYSLAYLNSIDESMTVAEHIRELNRITDPYRLSLAAYLVAVVMAVVAGLLLLHSENLQRAKGRVRA